jgi:hypothetical protein
VNRIKKSLLIVCLLLSLYALSVGPAVRFVLQSVTSARTPDAFNTYDQRLRLHYLFYSPIFWLRSHSRWAEAAFSCYESLCRPKLNVAPGHVLTATWIFPEFASDLKATDYPKDARPIIPMLSESESTGSVILYLPRSSLVVADGFQLVADYVAVFVTDSPDLSSSAVCFH